MAQTSKKTKRVGKQTRQGRKQAHGARKHERGSAGAAQLMSNLDLMTVAAKCEVVVRANNTLGLPGRMS